MSYLAEQSKFRNYVHNVDTSFTKEAISTAFEVYPGSTVTYTPTTGADYVVYEISAQSAWNPDANMSYMCTKLEYSTDGGSSWTDITETRLTEGNGGTLADNVWHPISLVYILDTWSGERQIRMSGRAYAHNTEYTLGRSYGVSEGTGSCPHVSIFSVMP